MDTLTDFLVARIAEDESFALSAQAEASIYDQADVKWHWLVAHRKGSRWHPTTATPDRVLAECEAKRRIVKAHRAGFPDEDRYAVGWHDFHVHTLMLLAIPYADHPDYDEEWRP